MHVNEKKKSNKLNCVSVKQTIKIICFKMIINMYLTLEIYQREDETQHRVCLCRDEGKGTLNTPER